MTIEQDFQDLQNFVRVQLADLEGQPVAEVKVKALDNLKKFMYTALPKAAPLLSMYVGYEVLKHTRVPQATLLLLQTGGAKVRERVHKFRSRRLARRWAKREWARCEGVVLVDLKGYYPVDIQDSSVAEVQGNEIDFSFDLAGCDNHVNEQVTKD